MSQRGLYVHIPFCDKKCFYCHFVITLDQSEETKERFFRAIEREIENASGKYGRLRFDTLYFGGGTPSVLTGEEFVTLTAMLREAFDFRPGHEFTCEFNPGDFSQEKIRIFHDLGVNRISLGAQAFQDPLLEGMGRKHRARDIRETASLARAAGIPNMSFDLILGLPRQSVQDFEVSLRSGIKLGAKQFSIYDLDLHDDTAWGVYHKKGDLTLPGEETRFAMASSARQILNEAGFVQYELQSFALPGFESKHNLIYWHNEEYLGLGPGAFSYLEGVRYQFAKDVSSYFRKCAAKDWACDFEEKITPEKKEIEDLLTGIRLREGVDLSDFKLIRERLEKKLVTIADYGLIEREGTRIAFTERGRFLAESTFPLLLSEE